MLIKEASVLMEAQLRLTLGCLKGSASQRASTKKTSSTLLRNFRCLLKNVIETQKWGEIY